MNSIKKAWLNIIFLVITLAVNTLGAIGVINGLTQKQISDKYLTLITPSPSTFSIWSVIYALLLISVIVLLVKKSDPYYQKAINQITPLYIFSCLMNIAWIVLFSFILVELSVIFIIAFAITLALIDKKLLAIREGRRWLLPLTFGLYSGWLFIATVVNIAAALVKLKWSGFGLSAQTWSIIILVVAIVLLIIVVWKIRNAVFPLPIAWAYFGIYQYLNSPQGFNGEYTTLPTVSLAGSIVLVIVAVLQFILNRFAILPAATKAQEAARKE
jgi:translocator protein